MATYDLPTKTGYCGNYGGKFVPEILIPALEELEEAYESAWNDKDFLNEYRSLLKEYVGRPTELTYADRLTKHYGKAKIYLKREDLLSDRYCWPEGWAKKESLPKPGPGSTGWRQQQPVLNSA